MGQLGATATGNGRHASMCPRLLIVGHKGEEHIATFLLHAAKDFGIETQFADLETAFSANPWVNRFHWRLRGRRPAKLGAFGAGVVECCNRFRPNAVLVTGSAAMDRNALTRIGELGIKRLNYQGDDPFNPVHRAPWFLRALPEYDWVFTPRRSNLRDLEQLGCRNVAYMPFGYAPEIHFPQGTRPGAVPGSEESDVFFAGAADKDRLPYITAILDRGYRLALYGSYWHNYRATKTVALGEANAATMRAAVAAAKVCLCLVRRANRDGHAMRTFELPAMGGCVLAEDTGEHREIFGPEGESALYFRTVDEAVGKIRVLIRAPEQRRRLAVNCFARIAQGKNSYRDRLAAMLEFSRSDVPAWPSSTRPAQTQCPGGPPSQGLRSPRPFTDGDPAM